MGKLIYTAITSVDGYIADLTGSFDWAAPDDEVHAFVNALERDVGTYLYGRRMYEVMRYWETAPDDGATEEERDYAALWQRADKVVFSTSLPAVTTHRTRLERSFDPAAVGALVADSARDVSIAGPTLAGHALRAGLVEECRLLLCPVVVGGGLHALPRDALIDLELVDQQRFRGGNVYLRYRVLRG